MSSLPTAYVPLPALTRDAQNQPYSVQFNDVYFSRAGGAEETQYVFLQGNDLPARFKGRAQFTLGEIGFGTGLNFLVAWQDFLRNSDPWQQLHYIAVEKYPLTPEQLTSIYGEDVAAQVLIQTYPLRLPGWHRIALERCILTLGFGDATELLGGIDAMVDAWFMDGFAPAKNPELWQEALFTQMARLSAPNASFATFTSAGSVKRGMQAQGFAVEKIKGFGSKREMLVGKRIVSSPAGLRSFRKKNAVIIGAGIAGATLARALAERGTPVIVLEGGKIAGGASGNPAAVLYPQLTKFYTPATAWHFTGYDFMLRQLVRWQAEGLVFGFAQPGMLRLPRADQKADDFRRLQMDESIMRYVSRAEASVLAGVEVVSDGWWLPHGSWIAPAELCHALLQHPLITLREQCVVQSLQPRGNNWQVELASGEAWVADIACVCAAQETPRLLPDIVLPIGISAGQVSLLPVQAVAGDLRCIISHRGYVIPQHSQYVLGATYDRSDLSGAVTEKNHEENLQHARDALPGWVHPSPPMPGRTSLRATTYDRLPYAGEVAPGLYASVGHGSRGMISAPLAAEVIASQIAGEMVPLSRELLAAVHPLRRSTS